MKRMNFKIKVFALIIVCTLIYIGAGLFSYRSMSKQLDEKYDMGLQKMDEGLYLEARDIFFQLENYRDSPTLAELANNLIEYDEADYLFESEQYELSAVKFHNLGDFQDSQQRAVEASQLFEIEKKYKNASDLLEVKAYSNALEIFLEIRGYKDSSELAQQCQIAITRLSNASTIAAGIRYTGCVTSDGRVLFAGENEELKETLASWRDIISIAINGHIVVGLKDNGHVVTAGQVSGYYIDTSSWEDIVAVSAGQAYIVGLKSDGTLVAQGHTGDGQINTVQTSEDDQTIVTDSIMDWRNIVAVSTGWRHTVGLDTNGDVHIAGFGSDRQQKEILAAKNDPQRAWTDIIAISAGGGYREEGHTVGLRKDGTVVAVGNNSNGRCNVYGDDWKDIIAIAAGDTHTLGLKSDGTIVVAGSKSMADTVSEWENRESIKFVSIAAGMETTLALTQDGIVYGTGYYRNGQLAFCNNGKPNPDSGIYESEWKNVMLHKK